MTPQAFFTAAVAFHVFVAFAVALFVRRWSQPAMCSLHAGVWGLRLAAEGLGLAVAVYAVSLLAPFAANLDHPRRLHVGEISGRLMGQALFVEGLLLAAALAIVCQRAGRVARAALLATTAFALGALYAEAYRLGPFRLQLSRHSVDLSRSGRGHRLRILHVTDLQTPAIGEHEERALRMGLAAQPDVIVLTGDYVQDALGRETEEEAARDLRALLARIEFDAPLGVFATEGDVGPACREIFAGTVVRCLTDESTTIRVPVTGPLGAPSRMELLRPQSPDGPTVKLTGLSRSRGRERNPALLSALLASGPAADRQIVLSHSPDFVDALLQPVDLAVAGHTHGGQFVLPFFGPLVTASRLPRRFAAGLNDHRGTPLHVSRGVGMERGFAPPVRFLCPPEVCILDLRL